MLEWPAQVRAGHGVVDDQWDAVAVRDVGDGPDVGDVARRVAERLDVDRLGVGVDQRLEAFGRAVVGKARRDAVLRQGVGEQVVGAAVQRAARDDVVAGLGDGLDRIGHRRLARGHRECRDAAFERRHALFEHRLGRVHDPGVDVAGHLQVEQVGAMLGAVERVRGGLVDRHGHRMRGGLGRVTGVHGLGFKAPLAGITAHAEVSWTETMGAPV